jgi:multiple sugar transport system permease protein
MTASAGTARRPAGRWAALRRPETKWAFIFLLPWIIGFVVFTAGPMIASFAFSFMDYRGQSARPPTFIGLENYADLLRDTRARKALENTIFYTVLHVPLQIVFALLLALLLNRVRRGTGFFRTVFYLPVMTPAVAVGALWLNLLNPQTGLINNTLEAFGIPGPNWTTDPMWIKPGIVIMSLWALGSTVVIYFAALRNVPAELYEAARIDGANAWQQFKAITVPMISGAIFFTVIVNTIYSLQLFAEVYAMFFGAAAPPISREALFYVIYLFQKAFEDLQFGYASAMAWLLFVVILIITLIQLRLSRRFVYYEGER